MVLDVAKRGVYILVIVVIKNNKTFHYLDTALFDMVF